MDNDGFQLILPKRGRRQKVNNKMTSLEMNNTQTFSIQKNLPVDVDKAVKRISELRSEILSSDFYRNCVRTLKKSLDLIQVNCDEEKDEENSSEKSSTSSSSKQENLDSIVCYGLGNFTQCSIACYQLCLFLCLKQDLAPSKCYVFDPVFLNTEEDILTSLDVVVIESNEEGKRRVESSTLFYLPHCGKALYNNLLWANWGMSLNRIIVLGNSFTRVFETVSNGVLKDRWPYLLRASSHAEEFSIVNNFRFRDVFNDLSIHVFPLEKIKSVPEEYWMECEEPVYDGNEIEIITNDMMKHFKQV